MSQARHVCVQKSEALCICDRKEGKGNCVAEKEREEESMWHRERKKISAVCCSRMSPRFGARHISVFTTTPTKMVIARRRRRHIYCVLNYVLTQHETLLVYYLMYFLQQLQGM